MKTKEGMKSALFVLLAACMAWNCVAQVAPQNPSPSSSSPSTGEPHAGKESGKPSTVETGKPSSTTNVNSAHFKTGDAIARRADLPAVVPAGRPVIGIALEGGGAVGLAHIGVLKWMEEHRIPIDRMSGTSMGALVGALYAAGLTTGDLERIAAQQDFKSLFYLRSPYAELSYRRREDEHEFPGVFDLGLKGGPSFRNSLISDSGLNDFLDAQFKRYNSSDISFDRLPIPFRCVASDLNTMQRVVFDGGPLPLAVRSSISIPGVFPPVSYNGHYLVDGGVLDNLPTDIVRNDLHADIVIGVHLAGTKFEEANVSSVFGVLSRAFSAGVSLNEKLSEGQADLLVEVRSEKFSENSYDKAAELIQAGYEAADKDADTLRRYSLSQSDYALYLDDRQQRVRPAPSVLQIVKVEGSNPGAQANASYQAKGLAGNPLDPQTAAKSLHRITGNNTEQATYETFHSGDSPTEGGSPLSQTGPDNGLLIRLSDVKQGPPFLKIGVDATAASSNVSHGTIDLRLLQTNLGGYGSELRTDVRLGFLTQVSSEYYHPLSFSGFYVQPEIGILRQPVYLWQNQLRISEHLQQQAGGGLQVGRTFSRNSQASLEYQNQVVRWHPITGSDETLPVSGDAQTATGHFKLDTTLSGLAPTQGGIRLELRAGELFHTVASQNAPLVELSVKTPFRITDKQAVYISFDANSYLRRNVTEPLRFVLGGPLRLSASSIGEYRGTDNYLARAGYTRKISSLPSGLGQGIYVGTAYEAGEIWSPEKRVFLRQDGLVTLIGAFPIGDLTLGGAVGDAGRRKIFITFGRLF